MSNRSTNRCVVLGLAGAIVATTLGATVSPNHSMGAASVLARAFTYVAMVFGAAVISTYLGVLFCGGGRIGYAKEVAVCTATTTLWLPPLLMFSAQRSWLALMVWIIFVVEAARLIARIRGTPDSPGPSLEPPLEGNTFAVLKQDFPSGTSMLGAFLIQGALLAAMGGRAVLAGLLYLLGSTAIAHRSFQMFRDMAALGSGNSERRVFAVVITTTVLVVFAWLPYIVSGGSGNGGGSSAGSGSIHAGGNGLRKQSSAQGTSSALALLQSLFRSGRPVSQADSFAVAKHILGSSFPQNPHGTNTGLKSSLNTNSGAVLIAGPVFPGVELYPDAQPHARLVAPSLLASGGRGSARSDPLSIPFDGVYWFWRGPSDHPPTNSVVMHGSPSARFFRSTDGDGMSMEARQNLGFAVDPKRYSSIEIDIHNADPFPDSVSILLKIRNTATAGKPIQTLGMEKVSMPVGPGTGRQTLRFHIPSTIAMGSFDELTVSYFLRGARSDRSARIAIERFRLVPRGG